MQAVDALRELAEEDVTLSTIDEEAAIRAFHPDEKERLKFRAIRPGESLADSSGYAIGAGLVQMSSDLESYKLLCTYSAGLTITQMQQHPCELELWAQPMANRMWNKTIGP